MTKAMLADFARYGDSDAAEKDSATRPLNRAASPDSGAGDKFSFGDFQLVPRSRLLLRSGFPVCLGGRAFDLLHVLLKCAGTLVSKVTLLSEVWPDTFVDESNLRFQVGCLRKALGDEAHLIKTVPGRGYVFTGSCSRLGPGPVGLAVPPPAPVLDQQDIDRGMQMLSLLMRSSEGGIEPHSQATPGGVWQLASLSILGEPGNSPARDILTSHLQGDADGQTARVQLLLPMLVLNYPPDANSEQGV